MSTLDPLLSNILSIVCDFCQLSTVAVDDSRCGVEAGEAIWPVIGPEHLPNQARHFMSKAEIIYTHHRPYITGKLLEHTPIMDTTITVPPESEVSDVRQAIHDILPDSCAVNTRSGATVVARTRHLDNIEARDLPIVVLVHGYPQSMNMFRYMIPLLPEKLPLFVPDVCIQIISPTSDVLKSMGSMNIKLAGHIPGYGESTKSISTENTEAYSKRAIGNDILEALLCKTKNVKQRVILIGHDRGARICHRLAVDAGMGLFPDEIELLGVALLDIVPTVVQFQSLADPAVAAATFHWPFLAASYPIPESMISALGGDIFADTMIRKWTGSSPTSMQQVLSGIDVYKSYFKKESVIAASCADYRAAALVDTPLLIKDQNEGRKIPCPVLVVYSESYLGTRYDVHSVWKDWVGVSKGGKGAKLTTRAVGNGVGHFLCEEAPEEVTRDVTEWIRESFGSEILG